MKKPYDIDPEYLINNKDHVLQKDPMFEQYVLKLLKKHGIDTVKVLEDLKNNGVSSEFKWFENITRSDKSRGVRYYEFYYKGKFLFTITMEDGPVVITAEGASTTVRFREVAE